MNEMPSKGLVKLALRIRIRPNPELAVRLESVCSEYTASYNRVAACGHAMPRLNGVEIHKATYRSERAQSALPSQLVISARMRAVESLKSVRTRQLKLDRKPCKKGESRKVLRCPESKGLGVRYDARSHRISLAEGWVELCMLQGERRQRLEFVLPDRYRIHIEDSVCTTELVRDHRGRWFLIVVVDHVVERPEASGRAIGVDLGVNRPVVTSRNQFLGERRWKEVDRRYQRLRRLLQMKGTRSSRRHLRKLRGRQGRFHRDCDHVLSKRMVLAAEVGDTLVLEDLTDIRDRIRARSAEWRRRMHGWSFAQLGSFVCYKADRYGRYAVFRDPAYTSQRCSRCGHTERSNRRSQSVFSLQIVPISD
jgi:putative transposase